MNKSGNPLTDQQNIEIQSLNYHLENVLFENECSCSYCFLVVLTRGPRSPRPPISSPKTCRKHSSNVSLIKICNLYTPPYEDPPVMRIRMPNPIGSGDHPGPLEVSARGGVVRPAVLRLVRVRTASVELPLCDHIMQPGSTGATHRKGLA